MGELPWIGEGSFLLWDTPIALDFHDCYCQQGCLQKLWILISHVSKVDLNPLLRSPQYNWGRQERIAGFPDHRKELTPDSSVLLGILFLRYLLADTALGLPQAVYLIHTLLGARVNFSHLLSNPFSYIKILPKKWAQKKMRFLLFCPSKPCLIKLAFISRTLLFRDV